MERLLRHFASLLREKKSVFKMFKECFFGFVYLLSHPLRLKRIMVREIRYGRRYEDKRIWLEWQKYDQYTSELMHCSEEAQMRLVNKVRIQVFSDMVGRLGKELSVLDVGCGNGFIGEQIWKMGNLVTCVDLPKVAVLAHKRRFLLVVGADAELLPFASNSFDVVLASEIIEHLWNPDKFLDEAFRVLKDNGHLIIATPEGREGLRWDAHLRYFTAKSLKQLVGAKFAICEVRIIEPKGSAREHTTPMFISLLRKSAIKRDY